MGKLAFLNCIIVVLCMSTLTTKLFVHSDCNLCNDAANKACVSKTEYQECNSSGDPFGIVYKCNEGSYCSILGTCLQNEELAECNDCGKCNGKQAVACIDTRTFALCLGSTTPSEIRSHCTGDLYCNYESDKICDTSAPTCSFLEDTTQKPTTTTTTPSPASNPTEFCEAIEEEGRFPIGTNAQTTCRQYVHCQQINGVWYGPIYHCPGNTYYDSSLRRCVTQMPSTCGNSVFGLEFRNIILE